MYPTYIAIADLDRPTGLELERLKERVAGGFKPGEFIVLTSTPQTKGISLLDDPHFGVKAQPTEFDFTDFDNTPIPIKGEVADDSNRPAKNKPWYGKFAKGRY